jgi:DNA-binding response OmpR family regulator
MAAARGRHSFASHRHVPARAQAAAPPGAAMQRIFLVFDDPMVARLATLTLKHGLCDTHAVASGVEAVTALVTWQPHLVVLDMDLEGSMILEQIGTIDAAGGRLPVIGLTRRGDLRNKLAAYEFGVDDILTVPFAPEESCLRG